MVKQDKTLFKDPFFITFLYLLILLTTVLVLDLEITVILQNTSVPNLQIRLLLPFYFILETDLQFASVFYISDERCYWRLKHFSLDILLYHCEDWLVLLGRHWQNSRWSSSVWSQFMSCWVILDFFFVCSTYEKLSVSFWKIPQALFQQLCVPRNTKV